MTNTTEIFAGEPMRYSGARHTWNNGFRRRWLANGARDAAVINAARRGDLDAVLARVDEMGGVRARIGIARSIIAAAAKLKADVSDYTIERLGEERVVTIPHLSWTFRNGRQIGVIEQFPLWKARG